MDAIVDGIVTSAEQVRIAGSSTFLGNPVDIAYDAQRQMIYVVERANGGGRVLGFTYPTSSGNIAPMYNDLHTGASAIYFANTDSDKVQQPVVIEQFREPFLVEPKLDLTTFKVFPNPVSDQLFITLPTQNEEALNETVISIVDNFGRSIRQINAFDLENRIDVSTLQNGVYYINISHQTKQVTKRFVKIR